MKIDRMKFEVKFDPKTSLELQDSAMYLPRRACGISDLDQIRKELETPNLRVDLVCGGVDRVYDDPVIEISEEVARKSGHFAYTNQIVVRPEARSLNRFVCDRVVVQRNSENGAIVGVRIVQTLDNKAVIAAWAADGYPLKWKLDHIEPTAAETIRVVLEIARG